MVGGVLLVRTPVLVVAWERVWARVRSRGHRRSRRRYWALNRPLRRPRRRMKSVWQCRWYIGHPNLTDQSRPGGLLGELELAWVLVACCHNMKGRLKSDLARHINSRGMRVVLVLPSLKNWKLAWITCCWETGGTTGMMGHMASKARLVLSIPLM